MPTYRGEWNDKGLIMSRQFTHIQKETLIKANEIPLKTMTLFSQMDWCAWGILVEEIGQPKIFVTQSLPVNNLTVHSFVRRGLAVYCDVIVNGLRRQGAILTLDGEDAAIEVANGKFGQVF